MPRSAVAFGVTQPASSLPLRRRIDVEEEARLLDAVRTDVRQIATHQPGKRLSKSTEESRSR